MYSCFPPRFQLILCTNPLPNGERAKRRWSPLEKKVSAKLPGSPSSREGAFPVVWGRVTTFPEGAISLWIVIPNSHTFCREHGGKEAAKERIWTCRSLPVSFVRLHFLVDYSFFLEGFCCFSSCGGLVMTEIGLGDWRKVLLNFLLWTFGRDWILLCIFSLSITTMSAI